MKNNYFIFLISLFISCFTTQTKAEWVDVSSRAVITQTKQALDRVNRTLFSYVTIRNNHSASIQGPLRLKIIDPTIPVNYSHGISEDNKAYFELANGLKAGESKILKINFNLARKRLHFGLALERHRADLPTIRAGRVSAAFEYTCTVDDIGVHCFGANYDGQLDVPDDLSNPYQVSSGLDHVCALDDTGVRCWGNNDAGQTSVPNDLKNPIQVAAGSYFTCAIDDTGVRCWGHSDYIANIPNNLQNSKQISAAYGNTCVIDDSGLHCWGSSFNSSSPTFGHLQNPKQVSLGYELCAIDDNGLHCSKLWAESNKTRISEEEINKLQNPKYVSVDWGETCVIDDNGVHCWNDFGKMESVPENLSNPVEVSAGDGQGCALDDKGLHCWGQNYTGQATVPTAIKDPFQIASGGGRTIVH